MRLLLAIAILVLAVLTTGTIEEQASSQEEVVVTVDSTNLRFSPESVTITEGDSVRFFWSGELLAHNAVAYDGLFDSGDASRNVDYRSSSKSVPTGPTSTSVSLMRRSA